LQRAHESSIAAGHLVAFQQTWQFVRVTQNTALSMSFAAVARLSLHCFDAIADQISATLMCQMPAKVGRLWRVRDVSRITLTVA